MNRKSVGIAAACLGVLVTLGWQQVGQTAPALTALDYEEIRQLYSRYAYGHDTSTDDGGMFARTFTDDGVFDVTNPTSDDWAPIEGHDQLKAFAMRFGERLDAPYHYVSNILIEPTTEGAMGAAFHHSPVTDSTGVYYDQLVKTPEGWRFKKRTWTSGGYPPELLQALEQGQ